MMRAREFSRDRVIREANKAFKASEPQIPKTDYAKGQQSFQENRERLKAQRLAREERPGRTDRNEVFLDVWTAEGAALSISVGSRVKQTTLLKERLATREDLRKKVAEPKRQHTSLNGPVHPDYCR